MLYTEGLEQTKTTLASTDRKKLQSVSIIFNGSGLINSDKLNDVTFPLKKLYHLKVLVATII